MSLPMKSKLVSEGGHARMCTTWDTRVTRRRSGSSFSVQFLVSYFWYPCEVERWQAYLSQLLFSKVVFDS